MRPTSLLAIFALAAAAASAGEAGSQPAKAPRFDVASMDRSVDPCADFYRFACGSWVRGNPIPPDESRWGRFNELQEANREGRSVGIQGRQAALGGTNRFSRSDQGPRRGGGGRVAGAGLPHPSEVRRRRRG